MFAGDAHARSDRDSYPHPDAYSSADTHTRAYTNVHPDADATASVCG